MGPEDKNCLICNCEGTMPLNAKRLSKALGRDIGTLHTHLCRSQLAAFEAALADSDSILVACTQEAPLFSEIAAEQKDSPSLQFVNIRENAGWSNDAEKADAKIAALLAGAEYEQVPARLKQIQSDGLCIIYGQGQQALEVARLLSARLSASLLLSSHEDFVPLALSDLPIHRGDIVGANGSFGEFLLTIDDHAQLKPSSRSKLEFTAPRNGVETRCALMLDFSGNPPLFSGHGHRDGYKWADPGDPAAVMRAALELSDMVGEYEKPIYVATNPDICAHSRSEIVGCSKCLDACPAGAIAEEGDAVVVDSGICAGCGACHALCPTGSIEYEFPARNDLIGKAQAMLSAYAEAGGDHPTLLLHDESFGTDMIAAISRYGEGLPANVIPLGLHAITMAGHVEMLALYASGAESLIIIADPARTEEYSGLRAEILLVEAILSGLGVSGAKRTRLLAENDPDNVQKMIWSPADFAPTGGARFTPVGSKRDVARIALSKLRSAAGNGSELISLPAGSPYGSVEVDSQACTLCMSCVSACPAAAMIDTPGEPILRFVESACVQCGLCVNTCPENALALDPRLNMNPNAMQPITLYEEEPFACIVCGKPFATKSTIERISEQLAGKHAMFQDKGRADLIKMCDTCRIEAQANSTDDPFAYGERPKVRTTEDYLAARKNGNDPD